MTAKGIAFTVFTTLVLGCNLFYTSTVPESLKTSAILGQAFVTLIGALIIIYFIWASKEPRQLNVIDLVVIVFFVYLLSNSILRSQVRVTDGLTFLSWITVYFTSKVVASGFSVKKLFILVTTILFIQVVIGFCQHMGYLRAYNDYFPITGLFNNPGPYAILLSLLLILQFQLLADNKKSLVRALLLSMQIMGLVLLLLCESRSAFIIYSFGLTLTYYQKIKLFYHRLLIKFRIVFITLSGTTLAIGSYLLFHYKIGSSHGRLLIWEIGLNVFKQNPLVGVGLFNFSSVYGKFQAGYFSDDLLFQKPDALLADDTRYAFNDLLQIFCETGVIGGGLMIVLLLIVLFAKRTSNSEDHKLFYYFKTVLICLIISGFFTYTIYVIPLGMIFWFSIGVISSGVHQNRATFSYSFGVGLRIGITLFIISLSSLWGFRTVSMYRDLRKWYLLSEGSSYNLKELQKFEHLLSGNELFLLELASKSLTGNDFRNAIRVCRNGETLSSNYLFFKIAGESYIQLGDTNGAIKQFHQASRTYPKLLEPRIRLAELFLKAGSEMQFRSEMAGILKLKAKVVTYRSLRLEQKADSLNRIYLRY